MDQEFLTRITLLQSAFERTRARSNGGWSRVKLDRNEGDGNQNYDDSIWRNFLQIYAHAPFFPFLELKNVGHLVKLYSE